MRNEGASAVHRTILARFQILMFVSRLRLYDSQSYVRAHRKEKALQQGPVTFRTPDSRLPVKLAPVNLAPPLLRLAISGLDVHISSPLFGAGGLRKHLEALGEGQQSPHMSTILIPTDDDFD